MKFTKQNYIKEINQLSRVLNGETIIRKAWEIDYIEEVN